MYPCQGQRSWTRSEQTHRNNLTPSTSDKETGIKLQEQHAGHHPIAGFCAKSFPYNSGCVPCQTQFAPGFNPISWMRPGPTLSCHMLATMLKKPNIACHMPLLFLPIHPARFIPHHDLLAPTLCSPPQCCQPLRREESGEGVVQCCYQLADRSICLLPVGHRLLLQVVFTQLCTAGIAQQIYII